MHVVIIGNGIAGITVAQQLRQNLQDIKITIISEETKYHYSRPALMYIYMGSMKFKHTQPYPNSFWKKNQLHLVHDKVSHIDFRLKNIHLIDHPDLTYDVLVLALGSKGAYYNWPGEDLDGVQTFTSIPDLEKLQQKTQKAHKEFTTIIVGGGLIGIEVAEMMYTKKIRTIFIVRDKTFWQNCLVSEEGSLIHEEIREHGIELHLDTELEEILPNEEGKAGSVITNRHEKPIPCDLVVLATGVKPNIGFLEASPIKTDQGILVDKQLRTNIDNVYACGDCAEIMNSTGKHTIESIWYTGKQQAHVVADNILGKNKTYERGILYNSAKFFSIDYHTYGENTLSDTQHFLLRLKGSRRTIKIVYESNKQIIGIHTLGIRLRQNICHTWIQEKRTIDYVIEHIAEANFDPEFFKPYALEIQNAWFKVSK